MNAEPGRYSQCRKSESGSSGSDSGRKIIPIYQAHPDAELVAVSRRSADKSSRSDRGPLRGRGTVYRLAGNDARRTPRSTPSTSIPRFATTPSSGDPGARAGKHVACTVPMATTLKTCAGRRRPRSIQGKFYMMMETVGLHARVPLRRGTGRQGAGRIQFLRGSHQQDMAGWPDYWEGPAADALRHARRGRLLGPRSARRQIGARTRFGTGAHRRHRTHGSPSRSRRVVSAARLRLALEVTRSLFESPASTSKLRRLRRQELRWQRIESERPSSSAVRRRARRDARLRPRTPRKDAPLHHRGCLRRVRKPAPVLRAGERATAGPTPISPTIHFVASSRPTSRFRTCRIGELDKRRPRAHESAMTGRELDIPAFENRLAKEPARA